MRKVFLKVLLTVPVYLSSALCQRPEDTQAGKGKIEKKLYPIFKQFFLAVSESVAISQRK